MQNADKTEVNVEYRQHRGKQPIQGKYAIKVTQV